MRIALRGGRAGLRSPILVWLMLSVATVAGRPVVAAEAMLLPSADAFLFAGEPNSNYGGAGQLAVADAAQPEGEYQSLLRFDLAGAKASFDAAFGPGQWGLESAALRLSTSNPNNPIFNANLAGPFSVSWMSNDSWLEGTGTPTLPASEGVTFNMLATLVSPEDQPLGALSFAGGNSGTSTYALNLSPGLSADIHSGGFLSLRLFADGGTTVGYNFSSRTFQTSSNRPVLTLRATAIPEPAAAVGAGVILFGLRPRRPRA